jgi:hypothetical protein
MKKQASLSTVGNPRMMALLEPLCQGVKGVETHGDHPPFRHWMMPGTM